MGRFDFSPRAGMAMGGKKSFLACAAAIFAVLFLASAAFAQEPAASYSGDFWSRSTLTGDWGGLRNELAAKGVTLDLDLTQIVQGVVSGGKTRPWEYDGRGLLALNVDTGKLGLWPGGFLSIEVEGKFGQSVNPHTGAIMPVNTSQIFPLPGENLQLNVPAISFAQFLSHYGGITFGKFDTMGGDMNEFAHGKGDKQFLNMAFNINPCVCVAVPYSTLGVGAIILPTKDPNAFLVTASLVDSNGRPDVSGFDDLSWNHVTVAGEARVRTDFFGLTGHQLVGGAYSNKVFASLDQSLRFIIENRRIEQEKGTWGFFYNFDQYLYEPVKGSGKGIGIFGRFGISDGNPNPLFHFYSIGAGGKGFVSSRPNDGFGIGYYFMNVRNPELRGLFRDTKFLRNEYGVEAYYDLAITPWLHLSPDLQVIRPAQKDEPVRVVRGIPPVIETVKVDTVSIVGLRIYTAF